LDDTFQVAVLGRHRAFSQHQSEDGFSRASGGGIGYHSGEAAEVIGRELNR
jgi:hypothetical protein